jgi:hypothetical protein
MILDPQKHSDLSQNLIDWSLARDQSSLKVSSKFVHNFLRYLANRQTVLDFALSPNGKESFKMIMDPQKHPDLPQNLTDWSLARVQSSLKVSSKFVHNFLRYLANRQTVLDFALSPNGKESFKMILDLQKHPNLPQNLTDWSLARVQSSLKVSSKFVHNILRYLANRQTDRGENITSLAEVIS